MFSVYNPLPPQKKKKKEKKEKNHQKTFGFVMISGGIEVILFA